MSFQGSLAELHLPDMLQLMAASARTGAFHLEREGLAGLVYMRDGKIVHAVLNDEQGEEAIYTLATWVDGQFRFEAGEVPASETITRSNTSLLMEAARRLDEWRVLQRKIPSVELIPEFVVQQHKEGQINLNTSEWLLLSKIDGTRSVKAIAQAAGISVFDAAKVLYGLVAASLLKLNEPPARASPAIAPRAPGSGSFSTPLVASPAATAVPTPAAGVRVQTGSGPVRIPAFGGEPASSRPLSGAVAPLPPMQLELARLNRVREICNNALGAVGTDIIEKHYQKARLDIEAGGGPEAINEAVHQIGRAAAILKGPSVTEALLAQIKALR